MPLFSVNADAQDNGDHEVHQEGCIWMPHPAHRHGLGEHPNCHSAVAKAKLLYPQSNGCAHCCPACHTG